MQAVREYAAGLFLSKKIKDIPKRILELRRESQVREFLIDLCDDFFILFSDERRVFDIFDKHADQIVQLMQENPLMLQEHAWFDIHQGGEIFPLADESNFIQFIFYFCLTFGDKFLCDPYRSGVGEISIGFDFAIFLQIHSKVVEGTNWHEDLLKKVGHFGADWLQLSLDVDFHDFVDFKGIDVDGDEVTPHKRLAGNAGITLILNTDKPNVTNFYPTVLGAEVVTFGGASL